MEEMGREVGLDLYFYKERDDNIFEHNCNKHL